MIANWMFHKRLIVQNCHKINDPEMGSVYQDFIVILRWITSIISSRCMDKFQHFLTACNFILSDCITSLQERIAAIEQKTNYLRMFLAISVIYYTFNSGQKTVKSMFIIRGYVQVHSCMRCIRDALLSNYNFAFKSC